MPLPTPRSWVPELVLGTLVGVLVVAPWTRGWLLLLDWTAGPAMTLTQGAYGLDGAQADAMPFRIGLALLRRLVGPGPSSWLPILAFFPLAAVGAGRLVGGPAARRLTAAAVLVVNPFVLHRLEVGHVPFLLGLALLPWVLASFLLALEDGRWLRVRTAAWFALLVTISPHGAWIAAVPLAVAAAWPRPTWRSLALLGTTLLAAAGVSAYGIALQLGGVHLISVGRADLTAFATAGDSPLGRLLAAATLQGFWRAGPPALGPAVVAVAIVVGTCATLGGRQAWRLGRRRLVVVLGASGAVGLLLAGGSEGLLGTAYGTAVSHLPLFAVMREAQKWVALWVVALAATTGFAAEWLLAQRPAVRSRPTLLARRTAAGACLVLPLLVAPSMLLGLGGRVAATDYPASWREAEAVMGAGPEAVLFLPWHQYQSFPFTGGRTVRTPAAAAFSRAVITSEAAELPGLRTSSSSPRAAFLDRLLARAGTLRHLGRQVAPLGVGWVVVTGPATAWLDRQVDLEAVLRRADLTLYRNLVSGTGRVDGLRSVTSVDDAIDLVEAGGAGDHALVVDPGLSSGTSLAVSAAGPRGGLTSLTPTRFGLAPGAPGIAVVPTPAHGGWRLGGEQGVPTAQGVLAFETGSDAGRVVYRPWRTVRAGHALSLAVLAGLLVLGLVEHSLVRHLHAARAGARERREAVAA